MTDYEYILAQCRKYHFTVWDEKELRECARRSFLHTGKTWLVVITLSMIGQRTVPASSVMNGFSSDRNTLKEGIRHSKSTGGNASCSLSCACE